MVGEAPERVVRMSSKRVLVTGLSHLLGRPPGAGARARPRDRDRHRRRPPAAEGRAGAHRVGRGRRQPFADPPHRAGGRDRHRRRHAAGRRLGRDLAAPRTREQRDRDDERAGRVQRARQLRQEGRLQVQRALLRLRAGRPGVLHRGHAPPAPAADAPWSATSSRPRRRSSDFADKNPDMTVTVLRFANGLGPQLNTSHMRYLALPVVPTILGFDPRYQFIHSDDMAGVLEHAVRHDLDGIYNAGADGVLALTEVDRPARQAVGAAAAAVGHRPGGRRAAPRGPRRSRRRCCSSCASAARSTTASSRPPATATRSRRARR